jgi:hypothetical protein
LISTITESGTDETTSTTKTRPAQAFTYQTHQVNWNTSSSLTTSLYLISAFSEDIGIRFGDVNGDGLADIVRSLYNDNSSLRKKEVWLNQGGGSFSQASGWTIPVFFTSPSAQKPEAQLQDMNGDGLADIVYHDHGLNAVDSTNFPAAGVFINSVPSVSR